MPTDANNSKPRTKATKATARRSTASAAGARGRGATPRATATRRATATASPATRVGDYAERAVLIPVGAVLIARERVATGVSDAISSCSSPSRAQTQLRKFERRGATARNRLEREVRKTRTRVERELRQRRRELDRRLEDGADLANRVQERVLSLV